MAGTRAAVAAAIVSAERDGSGAAGALEKLRDAKFDVEGTSFFAFVNAYFA